MALFRLEGTLGVILSKRLVREESAMKLDQVPQGCVLSSLEDLQR